MSKQALIVIDIQNDYFPGGKWPLHNMENAANNAVQVLQHARGLGHLIVHVHHEFNIDEPPFFAPGSEGAQIHSCVTPQEGELKVLKHQVNSFHETDLKAILDQHGVEHLTLVGSMSHMCIDAAARAASDYGYAVTVIEDACASRDLEFGDRVVTASDVHAAYMSALGFAYADIKSTADYLSQD